MQMFDSVTLSEIPSDAAAVAGYVGGNFPTFSLLAERFPLAQRLSVAVNAGEDAECLDIENGDAAPSDAPAWYARQVARGVKRPCFYANTSTMPSVIAALTGAKIARGSYRLWTAHFTGTPHIEPGSDATQWTDVAFGRNLDESNCVDGFFTDPPAPKPVVNAPHLDWFPAGSFLVNKLRLSERSVVEAYDKYRKQQTATKHPHRAQLAVLRLRLRWLAGRVYTVAHDQPRKDGRPSWNLDHRGWRYQQLIHRAQGQRFV